MKEKKKNFYFLLRDFLDFRLIMMLRDLVSIFFSSKSFPWPGARTRGSNAHGHFGHFVVNFLAYLLAWLHRFCRHKFIGSSKE